MVADKIKFLREQIGLTQSDLAKRLGITRSSVNAWEMGLSTPTTQYIVALSKLFHVSADYILGIKPDLSITMKGYTPEETALVLNLMKYIDNRR